MCLSGVLITVIVVLIILLAVFHYTSSGRNYWLKRNVPYREPCPLFGNFGATLTTRQAYTKIMQFFYDKFRKEKFVGLFQARRPTLMLIDLDLVKNVLSKEFSSFSDRISVATDIKREPLLRNLANMSGHEWKAMRQIVTPTFSSAKMKAMFPLIAEIVETLKNTLSNRVLYEVDVPDLMTRFTTDVIGSCAFGVDPGSLKNPESPFMVVSQKMFKLSRSNIIKRYCRTFFPRLFKLLNLRTYTAEVETFFSSLISQVLTERRTSGVQRHDFLQLMLNVENNETGLQMTDELITSNSFIFMLAGLDSSATTLSFFLYELARSKELQDIARQEILKCIQEHNGLNYEAVCAMKFTTKCMLETLRLHPATPLTTRLCTASCTLPGTSLTLKPKDPILIPLSCIQRDSKLFKNPDNFDPERFSGECSPPGFLAFGDGPRSCPAARFAQLMIVAALASILSSYSVEPCPRTSTRIEYDPRSVVLKNKGGIWLRFNSLK